MSTVLESPVVHASTTVSERLRDTTAAVRLSFNWPGVRKALSAEQKSRAAEAFDADGSSIAATKRLIDTSHPAFKAVTAVKSQATGYWKGMTLPFPEAGVRLIRQDRVEEFDSRMTELRGELDEAVVALERHYGELRAAAARRLGTLFDERDYPPTLTGLFQIDWDFPSVDPPNYLLELNSELYEQESRRVAARFDEAVQLAEEAFTSELAALVSHLADRLSGTEDGQPKIFRDSAVRNLTEFFERFRELNIRSSEQLDETVEEARRVVHGIEPGQLRENHDLRQTVARELTAVQNVLDDLLVDRPRRRILRRPR